MEVITAEPRTPSSLLKDYTFNSRVQYQCLDTTITTPLIERLLFGNKGRKCTFDIAERQRLMELHKEAQFEKCNHPNRYEAHGRYPLKECRIKSIETYEIEKDAATIDLTVVYDAEFFRHTRSIACTISYSWNDDRLKIVPLFEESGFDVVFRVTYTHRYASARVQTTNTREPRDLVSAVDTLLSDFPTILRACDVKNESFSETTDIRMLIVPNLENHTSVMRYIKDQKESENAMKHVVLVQNFANMILTEKEMTEFFASQGIVLMKWML